MKDIPCVTPSFLPSGFNELFVDVNMSSENRSISFNIPKVALSNNVKSFVCASYPYRGTSVEIELTDRQISGAAVLYYYGSENPTSYSETSTYTIYYR